MQLRDKDGKRASIAEDTLRLDIGYGAVERFTFEWLPQDRAIVDREIGLTTTRFDSAGRNVVDVNHTDDVVFAITTPLHISEKTLAESVFHLAAEERRMDRDLAFEVLEEEHGGGRKGGVEVGA